MEIENHDFGEWNHQNHDFQDFQDSVYKDLPWFHTKIVNDKYSPTRLILLCGFFVSLKFTQLE